MLAGSACRAAYIGDHPTPSAPGADPEGGGVGVSIQRLQSHWGFTLTLSDAQQSTPTAHPPSFSHACVSICASIWVAALLNSWRLVKHVVSWSRAEIRPRIRTEPHGPARIVAAVPAAPRPPAWPGTPM